MERTISTNVNRQLYSYQSSVNNQTDFTNLSGGLSGLGNGSTIANNLIQHSNYRTSVGNTNNENANFVEILQNATDDSKLDEFSSNINESKQGGNLDSEFNPDQSSYMYNDYSSGGEFSNEDIFSTSDKLNGRASTAPVKLKNEADEFRYSTNYTFLERLAICSNDIILNSDGKFDVDSEEGSELFKIFLDRLESLMKAMKIETHNRDYRSGFSQAYKHLYKEGELSYLTEILDSAQEGKIFNFIKNCF